MNSKPLQVWLVDDDASIRWVLEKALKGSGMLARCFDQADNVLTALRSDAPDVLMTDIRMPGRSGLDLLKEIQVSRPGLPVIVMTAHSDLDAAVAAYQGGAFEYLPKPFDIDKAVDLVRRAAQQATVSIDVEAARRSIPELAGPGSGHAAGVPRRGPVVPVQHDGAHHRRIRHRQGTRGARTAPPQPALQQGLRRTQYRRLHRRPARIGIIRPREGCIHRRRYASARTLRAGRRRHAVPRRNRRHVSGAADAVAAGAGGGRILSGGRTDAGESGRARHRRDPPGFGNPRELRPLSRGPAAQAQCHPHRDSAAAPAARRYS